MEDPASDKELDLERLKQFTGGDEAVEREVLDLFLQGAGDYCRALRTASPGDGDWRRAAHALKGSALGVGAREVASLAFDIELLGAAVPPDEVSRNLTRLEAAIERARSLIRRHYPTKG